MESTLEEEFVDITEEDGFEEIEEEDAFHVVRPHRWDNTDAHPIIRGEKLG